MKEKILKIINKEFGLQLTSVSEDDTLFSLGLDSIAFMALIVYLEEEFNIEFSFDGIFMNDYSNITMKNLMNEIETLL